MGDNNTLAGIGAAPGTRHRRPGGPAACPTELIFRWSQTSFSH
ncbi:MULTISPECIES: hypothetical protein [unclassified Micromonospora]